MATYQTAYALNQAKGVPGQIANEEKCNKVSRTVETAAGIPFGAPVQRGTNDHGVATFSAGTFLGFAVQTGAVPAVAAGSTLVDGYPQSYTGAFMTQGVMYVTAGGAVTDGAPVYWVTATNRYVAASGAGIVGPLPNVVFDTSGANGDIVEIAMNLRPLAAA